MCTAKKLFKLCTCNQLEIDQADWILSRLNHHGNHMGYILGESNARIYLEDSEKEIQDKILKGLNGKDVFDFRYQPNQGDLIQFKLRRGYLYFEYQVDRWEVSPKDNLSGYKNVRRGILFDDIRECQAYYPIMKILTKGNLAQRMELGENGSKMIKKGHKPHNIKI